MIKPKAPYKHYRLCDEAPCVKGSCMACVYEEGRASRDGLRKALEEILDTKYIGMTDNVWLVGKRALEADGEGEK